MGRIFQVFCSIIFLKVLLTGALGKNVNGDKFEMQAIVDNVNQLNTIITRKAWNLFSTAESIFRDIIRSAFNMRFDTLHDYYQIDPIDKEGNEVKWFEAYLDRHNDWREKTCGIADLHPTSRPDLFNLVRICFLDDIKKYVGVALNFLSEVNRDNFKKAIEEEFKDCPRTNLDELRKCFLKCVDEKLTFGDPDLIQNVNKTYFSITPELLRSVDDIDSFLFEKMSLCAVKASISKTEVLTKTPEALMCVKKKFPEIEKEVHEAKNLLEQAMQTIVDNGLTQVITLESSLVLPLGEDLHALYDTVKSIQEEEVTAYYETFRNKHADFKWTEETCGIVELRPTSRSIITIQINHCVFEEIRKILHNGEIVLNVVERMLKVFENHKKGLRECSRTSLDELRKCVHNHVEKIKILVHKDSDENISINSFVEEYSKTKGSLLQHIALCAVRASVVTTEVMRKTPEKLLCVMEKFPAIKKGVNEALACLKDDACVKPVNKYGSESLEFQIGRVRGIHHKFLAKTN